MGDILCSHSSLISHASYYPPPPSHQAESPYPDTLSRRVVRSRLDTVDPLGIEARFFCGTLPLCNCALY